MNKSLLVFPVFVIVALLLVKFTGKDQSDYLLWTGKIYTRADFYDRCKEITDKWTKDDSVKTTITKGNNKNLLFLKSDSYRNEDIYVFEIKIAFLDSNGINSISEILENKLKRDETLNSRYFQKLEFQKYLISLADTSDRKNINSTDLINREYLKYNLKNAYEDFQRRLSFVFPPNNEMTLIKSDNTRSYLIALIISLLAAFCVKVFFNRRTSTS